MNGVARLRIETPKDGIKRVMPRDLRVFLNDVEMPNWRNLRFQVGVDEGPLRANFDVYLDELEIDADAFAVLKDFVEIEKEPDADLPE